MRGGWRVMLLARGRKHTTRKQEAVPIMTSAKGGQLPQAAAPACGAFPFPHCTTVGGGGACVHSPLPAHVGAASAGPCSAPAPPCPAPFPMLRRIAAL